MRRRIAPAILAVTAMFALSGCFKMDTEIEVHSDDTISGSMVVGMEKEAMKMMDDMSEESGGSEEQDFFKPEDVPEGAKVEDYEDDTYVGQKMTFKDITLDELMESADSGDEQDAWVIKHEGDTYSFDGTIDMAFDEGEEAMMGKMMEDAEMRVAITFPGKVTETNGKKDGRTVVWNPEVGKKTEMHAEATEGGFPVLPVLGGLFVLVVLAAGGFVLYKRNSGASSAPAGDGTNSAAAYYTQGAAPVQQQAPVQEGFSDEPAQGWSATDNDDWTDPNTPR